MVWHSATYMRLRSFLTALAQDGEFSGFLRKLRSEAAAEHVLYGYSCDHRLVCPGVSTLPKEVGSKVGKALYELCGLLATDLRIAPRDVDLTDETIALGDAARTVCIDGLRPASVHGFVGFFGEICGVVFLEGRSGTELTVSGDDAATLFERRCRLARQLQSEVEMRAPTSWPRSSLSNREAACLHMAAAGLGASRTGELLGLSKRTVEDHLAAARRRLGARNGAAALALAVEKKLIRPLHAPSHLDQNILLIG